MIPRRNLAIATSFLTLLGTTSLAGAQGSTTAHRADSDGPGARGAAYWTEERASAAVGMPLLADGGDPEGSATDEVGPPGTSASGSPGAPTTDAGLAVEDSSDSASGAVAEGLDVDDSADESGILGTADVGDNDYVNKRATLWKRVPYRSIGKLLFSPPGGGEAWCTASVISPNNIIVTAAHCCYTRGVGPGTGFGSNYAFVPAMRGTQRPYGTFPYTQARVLTAWINVGGRQNDVCVLSLGPNQFGQSVSSQVGWLGRSWNQSATQHHYAFGYPGNVSSGSYLYECSAESYANCANQLVLGMGCNMTYGSSGGPWIRTFKRFASGAMNYVNGVVSGYDACTGSFELSFNAGRFTSSNIVPLCNDQGC